MIVAIPTKKSQISALARFDMKGLSTKVELKWMSQGFWHCIQNGYNGLVLQFGFFIHGNFLTSFSFIILE
jgi:hypothetical protein